MNVGTVAVVDPAKLSSPAQGSVDDKQSGGDDLFQMVLMQLIFGQIAPQVQPDLPQTEENAQGIANLVDSHTPMQGRSEKSKTAFATDSQISAAFAANITKMVADLAKETGGAQEHPELAQIKDIFPVTAQSRGQSPIQSISASSALSEKLVELLTKSGVENSDIDPAQLLKIIADATQQKDTGATDAKVVASIKKVDIAPETKKVDIAPEIQIESGQPAPDGRSAEKLISVQVGGKAVGSVQVAEPTDGGLTEITPAAGVRSIGQDEGVGGSKTESQQSTEDSSDIQPIGRLAGIQPGHVEGLQAAGHAVALERSAPLAQRVFDQITSHLVRLAPSGQGDVSFRLEPQWLGRLDVKMSMGDSGLTVQLNAHSGESQNLIQGGLAQLRETLSEHGFKVDRVFVSLSQSMATFDSGSQQSRDNAPNPRRSAAIRRIGDESEPIAAGARWMAQGIVDYRV